MYLYYTCFVLIRFSTGQFSLDGIKVILISTMCHLMIKSRKWIWHLSDSPYQYYLAYYWYSYSKVWWGLNDFCLTSTMSDALFFGQRLRGTHPIPIISNPNQHHMSSTYPDYPQPPLNPGISTIRSKSSEPRFQTHLKKTYALLTLTDRDLDHFVAPYFKCSSPKPI